MGFSSDNDIGPIGTKEPKEGTIAAKQLEVALAKVQPQVDKIVKGFDVFVNELKIIGSHTAKSSTEATLIIIALTRLGYTAQKERYHGSSGWSGFSDEQTAQMEGRYISISLVRY